MQTEVFRVNKLHWVDVVNPTRAQLEELASRYGLHATSVQDCLEPNHLPKFEKFGNIIFLILRAFDEKCSTDADTVQNLTRKTALFVGPDFILTVHRKDQEFLKALREKWKDLAPQTSEADLIGAFLADCLKAFVVSYQPPLDKIQVDVDVYEKRVLTRSSGQAGHSKGYYLKRRAVLIERMLRQTDGVVSRVNNFGERLAPQFQDVKENMNQLLFVANEVEESIQALISTQLALQAHRTNEVMRVLTLISLFFLPCNFITGIYGMNFEHMPELRWLYGYPYALGLMTLVSGSIFIVIARKGWLR